MFNFQKKSFLFVALLAVSALSLASFKHRSEAVSEKPVEKKYFFFYTSCHCDPNDTGEESLYWVVSGIYSGDLSERYRQLGRFKDKLKIKYENWGAISLPSRSYSSYNSREDAEDSRLSAIADAKSKDYEIHYVH